jgi:hypothetical protein
MTGPKIADSLVHSRFGRSACLHRPALCMLSRGSADVTIFLPCGCFSLCSFIIIQPFSVFSNLSSDVIQSFFGRYPILLRALSNLSSAFSNPSSGDIPYFSGYPFSFFSSFLSFPARWFFFSVRLLW